MSEAVYDLDGEDLRENPFSYKYFKVLEFSLWTLGAWPSEVFGGKVPWILRFQKVYIPIQTFIIICGQTNYIAKVSDTLDFTQLVHCIITTLLSVLTALRSLLPNLKMYSEIVRNFMMKFHLARYKHKGKYNAEMCNFINKVSHYYTIYSVISMFAAVILFNALPVYKNFRSGAYRSNRSNDTIIELSLFYLYPGFDPIEKYKFVCTFNFYLAYIAGTVVCSIDLLLYLIVFNIIGHIQILRNNFKLFPKPAKQSIVQYFSKSGEEITLSVEMYDAEENKTVQDELVKCTRHHRKIISFTEDVSTFFGPVLGLNYAFQLVSCSLLLLQCANLDAESLILFTPLVVIIFGQLIQVSIIFEIVNTVSDKLKDSVYDIPWESMNTSNRRIVGILLQRMQTPINVTAMELTTVGVTTMAKILKTTISYFAFLQSMNK